ncbi:FAA hydrolase family protein [Cryobacterium adonitolivorans]|uniref:FAA hydrolase family protein n=1 Tax=Cryobacterium adonitolivorans TaxID=1259189 RepID=A0A4R8W3L0_9MICO|nr:fumarylacetoacetate hydrolase family protein [Cryobacterium adonitolivorans]TFC01071.1 FAA hydrolase family protein [Cryobacterium adonitolivorans]
MRIANNNGRLALVSGDHILDVETASGGAFVADPMAAFAQWSELQGWASGIDIVGHPDASALAEAKLAAVSPRPRQVIGIGLNYADHAAESGLPLPEKPVVFTKFSSSVAGPDVDVVLPGNTVDWEAELVVVIGAGGRHIAAADARSRIAGYTVGQDLSERTIQWQDQPPQFSIGKSFENFAPIGPIVVTLDEFVDASVLSISATIVAVDGSETRVQDGSTDQLVFSVEQLVERLSAIVELLPGDLIFTGTPPGVGAGRDPKRFLVDGETLITEIEGIGRITQRFIAGQSS